MTRYTYQDGLLELLVRCINGENELVDPDSTPQVDIFPPGYDPRLTGVTDTDALVLGASPTKLETGIYKYEYSVTPDADTGTYYDRWTWVMDGISQSAVFESTVYERTNLVSFTPQANQLVRVEIASSVSSTSGTLLSSDYSMHFSYIMYPLYSSLRLIELDAGGFLSNVPDDTILTEIYLASLEADTLTFVSSHDNSDYYKYARQRYVTCRALFRLLNNIYSHWNKRKRLGDLDVTYADSLPDRIEQVANCATEFERILNAGGNITPDTSLPIKTPIPYEYATDRPVFGRGWQKGDQYIANAKRFSSSRHKRARKTFSRNPKTKNRWSNTR